MWGFRLMVRHQVPTLKMWVQFLQPLPIYIGVNMLKNSEIDWDLFNRYYELIELHLPNDYTFGYVGSIWGKWASDDRWFYIEDNEGKQILSSYNCNQLKDLLEGLRKHIAKKISNKAEQKDLWS